MEVDRIISRRVESAPRTLGVIEAARRMRDAHVGDLVIVDDVEGKKSPVGIVTDRDLVVAVLAPEAQHLRLLEVGDIMSDVLVTATEDESVDDVLRRMQSFGVRRVPVLDAAGSLCGVLSIDDIVMALADEFSRLADLVARQQLEEQRRRPSRTDATRAEGSGASRP